MRVSCEYKAGCYSNTYHCNSFCGQKNKNAFNFPNRDRGNIWEKLTFILEKDNKAWRWIYQSHKDHPSKHTISFIPHHEILNTYFRKSKTRMILLSIQVGEAEKKKKREDIKAWEEKEFDSQITGKGFTLESYGMYKSLLRMITPFSKICCMI